MRAKFDQKKSMPFPLPQRARITQGEGCEASVAAREKELRHIDREVIGRALSGRPELEKKDTEEEQL